MLRESIVRFARVLLLLGLLAAAAACDSSGSNTEGPETPEPPGTPPVDCDAAIDFEDACGPYTFADFGGGVATVIDNPDPSGINTSDKVTQMQKFAGEVFGGSALALDAPVDWSQGTAFTMKVWASRPADVLFKLEGLNQERSNVQSGSNSWEELCFDFADGTQGEDATDMTVIFDLGTVGDAADDPENWTFYFDGITQTDACEESGVAYELVFADEFDSGTAPSEDKWTIETGYGPDNDGWGNNEWQLYTPSPDNVRVEDGNLVISVQCPSPPCESRDGSITSGKINSLGKFEFKFGKVEARIKPPVGKAAWPAFWSLGTNFPIVDWPRSGEIDFMELHTALSNERTTHFTVHWCDESVQAPEECSFPGRLGLQHPKSHVPRVARRRFPHLRSRVGREQDHRQDRRPRVLHEGHQSGNDGGVPSGVLPDPQCCHGWHAWEQQPATDRHRDLPADDARRLRQGLQACCRIERGRLKFRGRDCGSR